MGDAWVDPAQQRADAIKAQRRAEQQPQTVPHRMRLSIRRKSQLNPVERARTADFPGQDCLVVRCDCMAQINDQDRDRGAAVSWGFWAFDYIALIPLTALAQPVFEQHVRRTDAKNAQKRSAA